ncbi:hypothetical protein HNY73_016464 [Argiope bruennichi]|uniref:Uncharacterized protein n=1 Tax=Argiope bruennichi TaxID=94029 RepID=A0A8T0EJT6_ARGBR|nr:hypothetical protein HNY73_016464 [Argiope bruennichi]
MTTIWKISLEELIREHAFPGAVAAMANPMTVAPTPLAAATCGAPTAGAREQDFSSSGANKPPPVDLVISLPVFYVNILYFYYTRIQAQKANFGFGIGLSSDLLEFRATATNFNRIIYFTLTTSFGELQEALKCAAFCLFCQSAPFWCPASALSCNSSSYPRTSGDTSRTGEYEVSKRNEATLASGESVQRKETLKPVLLLYFPVSYLGSVGEGKIFKHLNSIKDGHFWIQIVIISVDIVLLLVCAFENIQYWQVRMVEPPPPDPTDLFPETFIVPDYEADTPRPERVVYVRDAGVQSRLDDEISSYDGQTEKNTRDDRRGRMYGGGSPHPKRSAAHHL